MALPNKKKKSITYGAQYCCVFNCSNNSHTSLDARTGQTVRYFLFPNPEKERERCQKWIENIQRADLTLANLCLRKKVCSVHFAKEAFNCPTEIQTSRLLPTAVPTLVDCPNPRSPRSCRRKQPQNRGPNDKPTQKRKRPSCHLTTDHGTSSATMPQDPAPNDPESVLKRENDKINRALEAFKKENKRLKRQVKTAKASVAKLKAQHARTIARFQSEKDVAVESFIRDLPAEPDALMRELLKKKKQVLAATVCPDCQ